MNVVLRKDKNATIISREYINIMIKRLKSAHIIMVDSDVIVSVKIPEVDEKILYNVIRSEE